MVVACDSTVSRSVLLALTRLADHGALLPGTGEIELIAPDYSRRPMLKSAVTEVQRQLASWYQDTPIVSRTGIRNLGSNPRGWLEVPAPAGTERFNEILVPSWWSRAARRCLITTVPRSATAPRISPMSILADLAHPRQRLAARLHRNRRALAAELAAPWGVDLCVIVISRPPLRVVAATHDLVAAELTWLALAVGDGATEDVGPWEDPAVQRATQLGLGVLGPHQVSIRSVGNAEGLKLTGQIATRLGLAFDH